VRRRGSQDAAWPTIAAGSGRSRRSVPRKLNRTSDARGDSESRSHTTLNRDFLPPYATEITSPNRTCLLRPDSRAPFLLILLATTCSLKKCPVFLFRLWSRRASRWFEPDADVPYALQKIKTIRAYGWLPESYEKIRSDALRGGVPAADVLSSSFGYSRTLVSSKLHFRFSPAGGKSVPGDTGSGKHFMFNGFAASRREGRSENENHGPPRASGFSLPEKPSITVGDPGAPPSGLFF
jgi:hypothetical protein